MIFHSFIHLDLNTVLLQYTDIRLYKEDKMISTYKCKSLQMLMTMKNFAENKKTLANRLKDHKL